MKIAIVGNAADKFTPETELLAKEWIARVTSGHETPVIVSGGCHLGGVDQWAEERAREFYGGPEPLIFKPEVLQWDPPGKIGYKRRNIQIAEACDELYNIVVAVYPPGYKGWKPKGGQCYHCLGSDRPTHVKSGGCWTAKYAKRLGKTVRWIIIDPLLDIGGAHFVD